MIVLGVHLGHDSTAAIVQDGEVTSAVAEERLSRRKGHLGFPWRAIPSALEISGVRARDVDSVVTSFVSYLCAPPFLTSALLNPAGCSIPLDDAFGIADLSREALRQWRVERRTAFPFPRVAARFRRHTEARYLAALRELGITVPRIVAVDHHLAHAASAAFTAPFDDSVVVTADGGGDGSAGLWASFSGGRIRRLRTFSSDVSLGKFYSGVTKFCGFVPNRHEGKMTGLAARGDPFRCRRSLDRCVDYSPEEHVFRTELPFRRRPLRRTVADLAKGSYLRDPYSSAVVDLCRRELRAESREDIAAGSQAILEEQMCRFVQQAVRAAGCSNLVVAGGVFANVRMNQLLADLPDVDSIFVHPNMGDGGTAVGAALQVEGGSGHRSARRFSAYLGPAYDSASIRSALGPHGIAWEEHDAIEERMADLVAEGRVVGRFDGRMEYGPRALGNRSILADVRKAGIHGELNRRLQRDDFMPFAPVILAERAHEFLLDLSPRRFASPYMTICFGSVSSGPDWLKRATHVDGTCRAQLVTKSDNPSLHRFLEHFAHKTGVPAVINTSFNCHEEPIVCSPDDAVRVLKSGSVDALAIGRFLATRAPE